MASETAWAWNPVAKRYYNTETGRFMTRSKVLGYVTESIEATSSATDLLSQYVSNKLLSPADWRMLMRAEIKSEYIAQYLLGRGGLPQMTQADWGSIGGMLKEQYGYLDGFVAEISVGNLSEAQIRARARMYIRSAREAYERAHARVATDWGANQENWRLGIAEHCEDCIALSGQGWQPIGTFPVPGQGATRCKTNCACSKEYRYYEKETGLEVEWKG